MPEVNINIPAAGKNAHAAEENRRLLLENGVFAMNIIGSPGCGKTSILQYTAGHYSGRFAVIVGDVKTALDAERIVESGIMSAYAVETQGGCHLTALQINSLLKEIDLKEIDYLFIENVGNLVCPSTFDLGENCKVGVLSVPEGDEKVRKYPALFSRTDAVFINKIDLLPYCNYDIGAVEDDCRTARKGVKIFAVSATEGVGFEDWFSFLDSCSTGK